MCFYSWQSVYLPVEKNHESLCLQFWKLRCQAYVSKPSTSTFFFSFFKKKLKALQNYFLFLVQDSVWYKYQHKDLHYLYLCLKQAWRHTHSGVCNTCVTHISSWISYTVLPCTWPISVKIHLTFCTEYAASAQLFLAYFAISGSNEQNSEISYEDWQCVYYSPPILWRYSLLFNTAVRLT